MVNSLINHIRKFAKLDEAEIPILVKYLKTRHYKKKEYLLMNGQICRSLFFVSRGCLRKYYLNDKSQEQITQFAIEGWWMTDFFSFSDKTKSEYFIQAIEPSDIILIDAAAFDTLLEELPRLERYFRIIWQRNLAASQLRAKYLYELTKEDFYFHFVDSFPEFMQRVPQYMVASYLGLTPEYVSELRKKRQQ